ncbi:hypothetical protein [Ligilactobacillus aviarius]|uniref:Uncharacterized protein n=1 Tax=Ligilactobacillus aviarius TaxID=1606 RepID=A0A510WWK5_9LACO|nr:hypothetical protein [Ligilactobacillus aviarius]KRM38750.1 hypothetical protein FC33_GL000254 [Ligilactobacillus aviarius subsp. aviarius DSM 20655]GEK42355.1 hypothetical protein LAV01_11870 [Ligilactobacillus aviarius]
MGLQEYYLRLEAYQLKLVAEREKLALQAWFNQGVQATTGSEKNPKPKYETFQQFFDSEEQNDEVRKAFESNYISTSKKSIEKHQQEIILQRQREFRTMKRKQNMKKGG